MYVLKPVPFTKRATDIGQWVKPVLFTMRVAGSRGGLAVPLSGGFSGGGGVRAGMRPCVGEGGAFCAAMMAGVSAVVGRIGPLADVAGVYVDELGFWVVAYAAGAEGEGSVAEVRGWDAGDTDIERGGLNVLGMLGCVGGSAGAEGVVGLFGAIAGKDFDDAGGSIELGKHGVEEVEGARVVGFDFAVVAVAEISVELVEALEDLGIADAVGDVEVVFTLAG